MEKLTLLAEIAVGHVTFYPRHDIVVCRTPGREVRVFRCNSPEYAHAAELVDADLVTRRPDTANLAAWEDADEIGRTRIALVITDAGHDLLADRLAAGEVA